MLGNEEALQICNDFAIRNSYDEIYNINLDSGNYVLVHCINNQLVSPKPDGNFGEMMKYTLENLVYQEDRKRQENYNIEYVTENLRDYNDKIHYEFRRKGMDGNYYWVDITINRVDTDDIAHNLAVCFVRNVDNRKRQEAELQKKQMRYDMALKSDYNYICDVDVNTGTYTIVVSEIMQMESHVPMAGIYDEQTLIACERYIYQDDQDWYKKTLLLDNMLDYFKREDELIYEFRVVDELGVITWHKQVGRYFEGTQGEGPSIILISIDVTDQKEVEDLTLKYKLLEQQYLYQDNLYANSARFNALILQTDTIIYEWCWTKGVIFLSANWDEKFGTGRVRGKDLEKELLDKRRIHPDDMERYDSFSVDVSRGLDSQEILVRLKENSNKYLWYHLFVKQIYDADGAPDRIIGTMTNVDKTVRDVYTLYGELSFDNE